MTDPTTNVWVTMCEPFTVSKRYIGADVGTIYLQEGSEVTIILGKGSKIHIVNEGEEE